MGQGLLWGSLVVVGANETVVPASELQEAMKRFNVTTVSESEWRLRWTAAIVKS